ncbi:hypothetical protein HA402_011423 [Bradysia odoriphaga]|nr:hypothetical protein HA402_011423 [Bradysia odoriphaga]
MIWQKELNSDLYVDLLLNVEYPVNLVRLKRQKHNGNAMEARIAGNEKYKAGDFYGAMTKYNQSICLAENDSECISLAYANRSCCFYKLNLFSHCLVDIQLAKESNYPEHLMHKLVDREHECERQINSQKSIPKVPTLSFAASESLPCMSENLQIDVSEKYHRRITAVEDIPIGSVVIVEEDYVRFVVGDNVKCNNCGKKYLNFVPCKKCGGAMFCSAQCSNNDFHQIECEMYFDVTICREGNFFPLLVLRSVLIGLNVFSSMDEMIEFVENCNSTDPFEIPLSISSAASKYRTFFKLSSFESDMGMLDYRKVAFYVYHTIKTSILAAKFKNKSHDRFLAHLITHHCRVIQTNSFGSFDATLTAGDETTDISNDYEQSVRLVSSYFNHSCCPNVANFRKDNLSVCITVLPVRKGEQLFISYVDEDDDEYNTEINRQQFLLRNFGFRCTCPICENGILKNSFRLQDDPVFINIVDDLSKIETTRDMSTVRKIIENCKQFLVKHSNLILSAESIYVKHNLIAMMQIEMDDEV